MNKEKALWSRRKNINLRKILFSLKKKIECLWSQSATVSNRIWDIVCFEHTKKITFTKFLQVMSGEAMETAG